MINQLWGELPIVPFRKFRVQLWRQQILSRLQGGAAFFVVRVSYRRSCAALFIFFEHRNVFQMPPDQGRAKGLEMELPPAGPLLVQSKEVES